MEGAMEQDVSLDRAGLGRSEMTSAMSVSPELLTAVERKRVSTEDKEERPAGVPL